MSRKSMDEIQRRDSTPPRWIYNIYPPPDTTYQQNDDTRAQRIIDGELNDDSCVAAYSVPWRDASKLAPVAGHLDRTEQDFCDAVWGITEGKRDVRQLRTLPEFPIRRR